MRSIHVVLALALIVPLVPSGAAVGPDLLRNGSFEQKSDATAILPDGWHVSSRPGGVAAQSQVEAYDGRSSLMLSSAGGAAPVTVRSDRAKAAGCVGQVAFAADVYSGEVQVVVHAYDAGGALLTTQSFTQGATSSWVETTRAVTLSSSVASVVVSLGSRGAAATVAFVDSVHFAIRAPCDGPQPAFREGWENGAAAWAVESGSGSGVDCAVASEGSCSFRLSADCCDFYSIDTALAPILLADVQTFRVKFMGDQTWGDRDSVIQLRFDADMVNLNFNSPGTGGNNGIQLYEANDDELGDILTWPNVGEWYQAIVTIDAVAHLVSVELLDATGASLGTTSTMDFDGSALTAISVQSVQWAPSTNTIWVDDLVWE